MTGFGSGTRLQSKSHSEFVGEIPELDSFSEPALAMAILRQSVQDSYVICPFGEHDMNEAIRHPDGVSRTRSGAIQADEGSVKLPSLSYDRRTREPGLYQGALSELHGDFRVLHGELLQRLLAVHYQNQSWNSFLDCYLELLAVVPEQVTLVSWTRPALGCSEICGRTEELLELLNHFTRFSRNSKMVNGLQVVLQDWDAEKKAVSEGGALWLAANPSVAPTHAER